MKKIRKIIIIFCLIVCYCYSLNISNFPSKILIYSDSDFSYKLCPFLRIKGEMQTIASGKTSVYNLKLALGDIDIKDFEVKKTERINVIPCR